MSDRTAKLLSIAQSIITSWYFVGAVGWLILAANYPLTDIVPRYAG
jgi:hypothetical protein